MKNTQKVILTVLLFIIISCIALGENLRIGVAIIKDHKTEILFGEKEYNLLIERVTDSLEKAYVPNVVIESDAMLDGALAYVDIALFVSTKALDSRFQAPLEEFMQDGGVVVATFDTACFDIEGNRVDNSWFYNLLNVSSLELGSAAETASFSYDESNFQITGITTLARPNENSIGIGAFINNTEYFPLIKSSNTLYVAFDTFPPLNSLDDNIQLFEDFFIENILEIASQDYFGVVAMEYEELRPLASETRSLLRVGQREYRKTIQIEKVSPELEELYERSVIYSRALQFAVETRSKYHLPRYTLTANKIANELYEKASLVKIPYSTMQARGTYWAGKVEQFAVEKVPNNPIVFIGDSLTDRFQLATYFPNKPVINRGIGGDFADGPWDRKHLLGLDKNPVAIFLMIGTNNLLYNTRLSNYLSDVEKLILYLKQEAPNAKIYIQSICPMAQSTNVLPSLIEKYNKDLQELAKKLELTYIDIFSLFQGEDGYIKPELTNDGVHFTPLAYEIWTNKINEHL